MLDIEFLFAAAVDIDPNLSVGVWNEGVRGQWDIALMLLRGLEDIYFQNLSRG